MPTDTPKLTPKMARFHAIEGQRQDALVMLRLGGFYEVMADVAGTAAEAAPVVQGTRPAGAGWRILRGGRTRS
jgi:DNA mismatch repair ATPase MutS